MKPATHQSHVPDARADAALLALALLWGTSHVITKNVLLSHTPFFYTGLRFGIAAVLFALVYAGPLRRSSRQAIRQGLLLGVCSFTGISFYTAGLVFTQASKAGFITGLYLVFTPLLAWLFFQLHPTRDNLAGLLIAVTGFALLSYPQTGATFNWGDGLILCAALAWGAHIAATSAFARQSEIHLLAAWQVIVVAVLAVLAHLVLSKFAVTASSGPLTQLLALEARPNHLTTATMAQIGYMALLVTFVAALVQTWAQGKVAPAHAALFYALEPVMAALFAALILGEKLSGRSALGALLIVAGVTLSRLGLLSKAAQRAAAARAEKLRIEEQREFGA
ncbi:MAG: DMT family transporter [Acidobacteria bacterium]|nr:DMT family transporter [Acidobacteriota bacterium]MBI3421344.1 DMT family transporter [Acidobacteriota bacterium]